MSFITPTITNAGAVVNGDNATPTFMNANLDPLKNFTGAIDGLTRVSTSATPYNVTANTQVVIYVDASGGNKVVNLPACTGQLHSITVKKIDTTYNTVTVTRTGSDTIESVLGYSLSPITTTDSIAMPNEARTYSPNGTQWRVESRHFNNLVNFKAYLPANVTVTGTPKLTFSDSTGWDTGDNFDNANSRFVAPIGGIYNFQTLFRFDSLSTTVRIDFRYFVNGLFQTFFGDIDKSTTGGKLFIPSAFSLDLNANDYVELYVSLISGSGVVSNANAVTFWQGQFTGIYT